MIYSADPDLSTAEVEAVTEAMREGTLSTGELVSEFEDKFASYVGREHGAAVCSGGVALELALEVSDLESGDAVVLSPRNCAAVLYPVLRQNLVPVFSDIEPLAHDLDASAVRDVVQSLDRSVDGLLATHLHGAACDLKGLASLAEEHDLELIEDVCQSPGAVGEAGAVGSVGSLAVCSFGATKNLTTAEGGMVVGDERELIETVRTLRSSRHGAASRPLRSVRMSDVEAAMGLEQLNRYDGIVSRRQRIAEIYRSELPPQVTLSRWPHTIEHVYLNYPVLVEEPEALRDHLREHGVETNTYDALLSDYECLRGVEWHTGECEQARRIQEEGLVLPMHSKLDEEDVRTVVDTMEDFYKSV